MKSIILVLAVLISTPRLAAQTDEATRPGVFPSAAGSGAGALSNMTVEPTSSPFWTSRRITYPGRGTTGRRDLRIMWRPALQQEGVPTLERRQIRLILGERELQTGFPAAAEAWQMAKLPAVACFVSGHVSRTAPDRFALSATVIQAGRRR